MARKNKPRLRAPDPALRESPHERRALEGFLAFAVALVYLFTLYPGVPGGDSGELIAAARTLGVAHPPGYPLYTWLGHVFSWIPVGCVAWRVNLLSAACGWGAAILLWKAVARWSGSAWAATLGAGLFAFSSVTWRYSVAAEVFALNNLFCAALLYLLVRFQQEKEARVAYLSAFVVGLGLSNHHLLLFYGIPFALAVLWIGKDDLLKPTALARLAGLFALGFLPYLHLPLRGSALPPVLWGSFDSLQGVARHFLRAEYGTFRLAARAHSSGWAGFLDFLFRLSLYLKHVAVETLVVGLVPVGLGIVQAWRGRSALGVWTIGAFALYVIVFHALANLPLEEELARGVQERFWQQPDVLVFAWLGLGLATFLPRLGKLARPLVGVLVGLQLLLHFASESRRGADYFDEYGRAVLEAVPQGGILLARGDIVYNTLKYLQLAEGVRPDIHVLDQNLLSYRWIQPWMRKYHPEIVMPGTHLRPDEAGGFSMRQFLDANSGRFAIYSCDEIFELEKTPELASQYVEWPMGLAKAVLPRSQPVNIPEWVERSRAHFQRMRPERIARFPAHTWESVIYSEYWEAWVRLADRVMMAAESRQDPGLYRIVAQMYDEGVNRIVDPLPPLFKNAGAVHSRLSAMDAESNAKARRYWARYLAMIPEKDRDEKARVEQWLALLPPAQPSGR